MRYFFHVRLHDRLTKDPEGIEFDGIDTVREEAMAGARDMMAERLKAGRPLDMDTTFEVHDDTGAIVLSLSFVDVLLSSLAPGSAELLRAPARDQAAMASSPSP
ncbi:hypothetical protein ASG43_17675 [Aureimonas sp. Leaf454]|uniref:DUF6894 family protein n=1 Tax=Aureimonas sp. Leaf454 TaxID=1736381 RepID=UPI0006F1F1EF|nr:hypothetical protein [Aureimonas sp. Leaf454]KQT53668.1 hypothetical protein ASG43_17675 [Aureimonas sp. Leaf454]